MKSINRRALTAIVIGSLTVGATSVFAEHPEKAHGCCAQKQTVAAYDQTAERFKAKFGREYPGARSPVRAASRGCCKNC
jgi:hypothetical protein